MVIEVFTACAWVLAGNSSLSRVAEEPGAEVTFAGVAHDGDADRAIFVDEKGQVHWGDRSFALIAENFLKNNPIFYIMFTCIYRNWAPFFWVFLNRISADLISTKKWQIAIVLFGNKVFFLRANIYLSLISLDNISKRFLPAFHFFTIPAG